MSDSIKDILDDISSKKNKDKLEKIGNLLSKVLGDEESGKDYFFSSLKKIIETGDMNNQELMDGAARIFHSKVENYLRDNFVDNFFESKAFKTQLKKYVDKYDLDMDFINKMISEDSYDMLRRLKDGVSSIVSAMDIYSCAKQILFSDNAADAMNGLFDMVDKVTGSIPVIGTVIGIQNSVAKACFTMGWNMAVNYFSDLTMNADSVLFLVEEERFAWYEEFNDELWRNYHNEYGGEFVKSLYVDGAVLEDKLEDLAGMNVVSALQEGFLNPVELSFVIQYTGVFGKYFTTNVKKANQIEKEMDQYCKTMLTNKKILSIFNTIQDYTMAELKTAFRAEQKAHNIVTSSDSGNASGSGQTVNKPAEIKNLTIKGTNYSEELRGGAGNDTIDGLDGDDELYGLAGNDTINGGRGNDIINGGTGNDSLQGGVGDDTYIFGKNTGTDTVLDGIGTNLLSFNDGITSKDIMVTLFGDKDIMLSVKGGTTKIVLKRFREDKCYRAYYLRFAYGTEISADAENSPLRSVSGTDGDDVISAGYFTGLKIYGGSGNDTITGSGGDDVLYGGKGNDIINGGSGHDTLYGEDGNDVLKGGAGNDILYGGYGYDCLQGGSGIDTYVFGKNAGTDKVIDSFNNILKFVDGIKAKDLIVTLWGEKDIMVSVDGGNTKIILEKFRYNSDYRHFIFVLPYSQITGDAENSPFRTITGSSEADTINANYYNGMTVNAGAGDDMISGSSGADKLYGEAGNDTIKGGIDNDILDGGIGNDRLEGGSGADTYVFGKNTGTDTVLDGSKNNILKFTDEIKAKDLVVTLWGEKDIMVSVKGGTTKIILEKFRYNSDYRHFGMKFTYSTIAEDAENNPLRTITGSTGADTINACYFKGMTVNAGPGDDTITGSDGDDVLYGGSGDDFINGSSGNDTLYGEAGNDTIKGGAGDDILDGGVGNDWLEGGSGDDTYIFGKTTGTDTVIDTSGNNILKFADGITAKDIVVTLSGTRDVMLSVKGGNTKVILEQFQNNKNYRKYTLEFSDGTCIAADAENSPLRTVTGSTGADSITAAYYSGMTVNAGPGNDTITGSSGDDVLYGGSGDDIINGSSGNDTLYGEAGNDTIKGGAGDDILDGGVGNDRLEGGLNDDTYVFGKTTGTDTVIDSSGNNILKFVDGISISDIAVEKTGKYDITISVKTGNTKVVLDHFTYGSIYRNFELVFDDKSKWTINPTNYAFELQSGINTKSDNEYNISLNNSVSITDIGGNDVVNIGGNMLDILFERENNNLNITSASNGNSLTIHDWYVSDNNQIETIVSNDGYWITNKQVQLLIDEMAAFTSERGISTAQAYVDNSADNIIGQMWTRK